MPTYKAQVLQECWRIAVITKAIAEAAERQFMAPIDDPDFEVDQSAPDYAGGMRVLRRQLERAILSIEGADPDLDDAIHQYRRIVLRVVIPKRAPLSIN